MVRCVDALDGPPTPWVPPRISPSPIPPLSEQKPPTSLWKGEGQMQRCPGFSVSSGVCIWAHISQERGGDTFWGFCMWLRVERSGDDEDGGGRMGENG